MYVEICIYYCIIRHQICIILDLIHVMFLLAVFRQICYFPLASVVRRLFFYGNSTICDGNSTICDSLKKNPEWSEDAETNMFQVKIM